LAPAAPQQQIAVGVVGRFPSADGLPGGNTFTLIPAPKIIESME
jgi:hypothetical protein